MNTLKLTAILFALFTFSNAQAGFDITRMTTVVDDYSGSCTVTKSGRFEDHEFIGTSIAEFSNFHLLPENEALNLSGKLSKTLTKAEGNRTTHSDGQLVLTTAEKTVNISFTDLLVSKNQDGVTITGEITINEETFEADKLPSKRRTILKRYFS